MRIKDDKKKEALFNATVKMANELGFASCSVAKIAKEANVSSATLYIYHKNKEDLLVSTFLKIRRDSRKAILKDFDDTLPLRDILKNIWINLFDYVSSNPEYSKYSDQFSNSPYISLINKKNYEKGFTPAIEILKRGIEQKILKNVEMPVLLAFLLPPAIRLARSLPHHQSEVDIETAFSLAWDAIKL